MLWTLEQVSEGNIQGCWHLLGNPAHGAHLLCGIKSMWGLTCRDLSVFAGWIFTELICIFYVSFIISVTYFCIRDVYITLRDTNMSTLGKKLKVYLNFPSFRLTCFSCSFAKIKEVKYGLSFTLRYSFHSSRGTQKCPNPLLLHSCFFPKFSALMQSLQLRWWPYQAV